MRSREAASGIFCREHAVHVKRFSYTFEFLGAEILKSKADHTRRLVDSDMSTVLQRQGSVDVRRYSASLPRVH